MRPEPWVSIVTPSFNQGRFLRRTIESVLGQDYPQIEYLVIDGGSSDESVKILESYGKRFFWVSEPDRGQAHAVNKGLSRARGDILAYLNSDDVLLPGAVSTAVAHFQNQPDWDLIYGQADVIDGEDRVLGGYSTAPFSFNKLLQFCYLCQPAVFWRRRIWEKVGPFNENLFCNLDYEYWLRITQAGGKLVQVPERLAQSRSYPETKTLSSREKVYQEHIQILLDQVGFAELGPFFGLWRQRCWHKTQGWPHRLRWLPFFCPAMAFMHYVWTNARPTSFLEIFRGLARGWTRFFQPRQRNI